MERSQRKQRKPLPRHEPVIKWKPVIHVHVYDPSEFSQLAWSGHRSLLSHSSISIIYKH